MATARTVKRRRMGDIAEMNGYDFGFVIVLHYYRFLVFSRSAREQRKTASTNFFLNPGKSKMI
jgi:hypothetical protein